MVKSVVLIGLGGIGMLYDLTSPDSVQSHARAFLKHPGFKLVGAVDPEDTLREIFTENYKALAFSTVTELLADCSPEVVVVASPTHTHFTIVDELLQNCKPKVILCEKPLAYRADEAQAIADLCHVNGVKLFVNYMRRADPGVIEVKARLISRQVALPFKAIIWYSKGVIHNGSHFLDLMMFWFGPVQSMKLITIGRNLGQQDAEPDFQVEFEHGTAIFCSANEENFSHYTIEVVANNGRLRYEQGGFINWQVAVKHPTLDNYCQLQAAIEAVDHDMSRYQYRVAEQLSQALKGKPNTLCTGDDGVTVINWLEILLNERIEVSGK
jgi:predicted dehydrogenase